MLKLQSNFLLIFGTLILWVLPVTAQCVSSTQTLQLRVPLNGGASFGGSNAGGILSIGAILSPNRPSGADLEYLSPIGSLGTQAQVAPCPNPEPRRTPEVDAKDYSQYTPDTQRWLRERDLRYLQQQNEILREENERLRRQRRPSNP